MMPSRIKTNPLKILAVISLLLFASTPSWGADFDKGLTAYQNGDYVTALNEFTPLAEQGDADAQFSLGYMYDNGWGVLQNYATAYAWYNIAASNGDEKAAKNRNIIAKSMTAEQLNEAQALARNCIKSNYKNCTP